LAEERPSRVVWTPQVKVCDESSESFEAGRLKQFVHKWREITSDEHVLEIVDGVRIEFDVGAQIRFPGVTGKQLYHIDVSKELNEVIEGFLAMKVIKEMAQEERGFISPIFTVPKKDGSLRMILNLKKFNKNVRYRHFKMDTLESAVSLMTPGCFMASVDLKHAYYTVAMHEDDQKFLQFEYGGRLFQFTCLPMGFASAPRIFTKLCKPVFSTLHENGHIIVGYIDDSYLQGDSVQECQQNIEDSVQLMRDLGFIVNLEKSVLTPSHMVEFLGFDLNSIDMTVRVTERKRQKIIDLCKEIKTQKVVRIRLMASLIGKLVSACNGAEFGSLYYKDIEIEKNQALKMQAGNFDKCMEVTERIKENLEWWITNLHSQVRKIDHGDPEVVIFADASNKGWVASKNMCKANGMWNVEEQEWHINVWELYAIYYGLKSLCSEDCGRHIKS
jgi:hypothetical protein